METGGLERQALEELRRGDLQGAHRTLSSLFELRPEDDVLRRRIAQVEQLIKQRDDLRARMQAEPLRYAHAYIQAGRLVEGLQLLRAAVARDPNNQRLRMLALEVAKRVQAAQAAKARRAGAEPAKEAEARAAAEVEARARKEAEERAQREAEERAQREAEERAQREAEERARREAEERARREAEERARREAEERARREAEERARREAEERAREAEVRAAQRAAPADPRIARLETLLSRIGARRRPSESVHHSSN